MSPVSLGGVKFSMRPNLNRLIALWLLANVLSISGQTGGEEALLGAVSSEVLAPIPRIVRPLLEAICPGYVVEIEDRIGCGDSSLEQNGVDWKPPYEVNGVLFGHFLSPESEDVILSGARGETHPYLWGGTLLLTQQGGVWKPLWYRSGVITGHCRKVSLATEREILLCEATDEGMGHSYHLLYTVDLLKPTRTWDSTLLVADNYDSIHSGGVQRQFIDRVVYQQTSRGEPELQVYVRHGNVRIEPKDQEQLAREGWPNPVVSEYRIDFRLEGDRFKVTPETAEAFNLFVVR